MTNGYLQYLRLPLTPVQVWPAGTSEAQSESTVQGTRQTLLAPPRFRQLMPVPQSLSLAQGVSTRAGASGQVLFGVAGQLLPSQHGVPAVQDLPSAVHSPMVVSAAGMSSSVHRL